LTYQAVFFKTKFLDRYSPDFIQTCKKKLLLNSLVRSILKTGTYSNCKFLIVVYQITKKATGIIPYINVK